MPGAARPTDRPERDLARGSSCPRARVQHTEPVTDRDAGGEDQELLGEPRITWRVDLVDRLPRDQHRHHDRLAAPGRHLQRDAWEPVVVQKVLLSQTLAVVGGAMAAGDLGQEDCRLHRLSLAEEDWVVTDRRQGAPVQQKLAAVGADSVPVVRPPPLDVAPDVVDEAVLLDPVARGVEVERLLLVLFALLLLGHRDERFARPPALLDLTCRAGPPDHEVPLRRVKRRVQYRVAEVNPSQRSSPRPGARCLRRLTRRLVRVVGLAGHRIQGSDTASSKGRKRPGALGTGRSSTVRERARSPAYRGDPNLRSGGDPPDSW